MDGSSAQSIYRAEKARALQERRMSHAQLMAEAKEAFVKMLADAQLARKGGRPRTNPLPPVAAAAVTAGAPAKPKAAAAVRAVKPAPKSEKAKTANAKNARPRNKTRLATKRVLTTRGKPAKALAKKGSSARASRPVSRSSKRSTKKR